MKTKFNILLAAMLACAGSAFAERGHKVALDVVPEAFADNSPTPHANTLYLFMASNGAYSTPMPYCSQTRAYIRAEDKHIQATFWSILSLGRTLHVQVDDTKPIKDGACQIISLWGVP